MVEVDLHGKSRSRSLRPSNPSPASTTGARTGSAMLLTPRLPGPSGRGQVLHCVQHYRAPVQLRQRRQRLHWSRAGFTTVKWFRAECSDNGTGVGSGQIGIKFLSASGPAPASGDAFADRTSRASPSPVWDLGEWPLVEQLYLLAKEAYVPYMKMSTSSSIKRPKTCRSSPVPKDDVTGVQCASAVAQGVNDGWAGRRGARRIGEGCARLPGEVYARLLLHLM